VLDSRDIHIKPLAVFLGQKLAGQFLWENYGVAKRFVPMNRFSQPPPKISYFAFCVLHIVFCNSML